MGQKETPTAPMTRAGGPQVTRSIRTTPRADKDIDDHFGVIAAGAGIDAAARFHDRLYEMFGSSHGCPAPASSTASAASAFRRSGPGR